VGASARPEQPRSLEGLQSFGAIDVTADALTVTLRGIDGRERYSVELPHVLIRAHTISQTRRPG